MKILTVCMVILNASWLLCSYNENTSKFISDCSKEIKDQKQNCDVFKTSYILWLMKHKAKEKTFYCLLKFIKDAKKIDKERKRQMWVLLYLILKASKKSTKCSKLALKQANIVSSSKVDIPEKWTFLGPFQIGKPEIDGIPIDENSIENRWNQKIKYYSELVDSGIVKWKDVKAEKDGTIKLSPILNWNILVMGLQSMAVTEWQGILVNEFSVTTHGCDVKIQCLGVNVFFIDDKLYNGDIYHRSQFWYPLKLDVGVHIIKVPVRFAGNGAVKCSILQTNNAKQKLVFHASQAFTPEFVNGNLFSNFISLPFSNMDSGKKYTVKDVTITSHDIQYNNISVEIINNLPLFEGQVGQIILKMNIKKEAENHQLSKCSKTIYKFQLNINFIHGIEEKLELDFRCRTSEQSFLFTYFDHDGSVQQAAAVKPLKPCMQETCPVMLTLHGTGVGASNQADSYKQMVDRKFLFGVEKVWLLAPTRHGAHNWEGPGEKTSMTALHNLAVLTKASISWLGKSANSEMVIFAGHSMGGHGAWQLTTHHPDKALAVISAAGWLSKEEYGDSNRFYGHDVSISHVDPVTKFIQESCIVENQADKHVSNLKGIPVMIRVGSNDQTVHPYYGRRMLRLLKENDVEVNYKEFPGKEHWWWDTEKENDGGVSNDKGVRKFIASVLDTLDQTQCSTEGCSKEAGKKYSKNKARRTIGTFEYTVYNPASFSGGRGIKPLQQEKPLRRSVYHVSIDQSHVTINTKNIQRVMIYDPIVESIGWLEKEIRVDGSLITKPKGDLPWVICKQSKGVWEECRAEDYKTERLSKHYGPARRIAEKRFVIVVCNDGNKQSMTSLNNVAVFLANLFYLTSDAHAPILVSRDLSEHVFDGRNIILLGTSQCVENMPVKKLVQVSKNSINIGSCSFKGNDLSTMYLTTFKENMALVLTASWTSSITQHLIRLAFPTIPPMTRSPFSNLLPDYVILSEDIQRKGPGGYLCSGFWGNKWEYEETLSSCLC